MRIFVREQKHNKQDKQPLMERPLTLYHQEIIQDGLELVEILLNMVTTEISNSNLIDDFFQDSGKTEEMYEEQQDIVNHLLNVNQNMNSDAEQILKYHQKGIENLNDILKKFQKIQPSVHNVAEGNQHFIRKLQHIKRKHSGNQSVYFKNPHHFFTNELAGFEYQY